MTDQRTQRLLRFVFCLLTRLIIDRKNRQIEIPWRKWDRMIMVRDSTPENPDFSQIEKLALKLFASLDADASAVLAATVERWSQFDGEGVEADFLAKLKGGLNGTN